jgi:hypothetical protein
MSRFMYYTAYVHGVMGKHVGGNVSLIPYPLPILDIVVTYKWQHGDVGDWSAGQRKETSS